jgi:hypothetical protein
MEISPLKFLETVNTRTEIRKLLKGGDLVRAAVSYWGAGAIEGLGIAEGQNLDVVCDILSGGCNPDEVRRLQRILGAPRVRTYDRLHAKVWLSERSAVLGSSNASSNGLGFDGIEAASLVEANVIVDATDAVAAIKRWWTETIWNGSRKITEADLRQAARLRARHRAIRPLRTFPDLLTGLRTEPEAFADRNLYVWVWEHGTLDAWAEDALGEAQKQYGNDEITCWQDVENPPPSGSFVIEFNSEVNPPAFTGIYRVLLTYKAAKGKLLLCTEVHTFEGLKLGHRATWRAAAKAASKEDDDEWEADEFARRFLQKQLS